MIKTKQISKNIIYSVIEVLVSTFILFFLYRYILEILGAKQLGLWSLILSTASIANISEFGLSGSVVRFVAKYIAIGKNNEASKVIQTALGSIGIVLGLLFIIVYFVLTMILHLFVPLESLNEAKVLLPYATFSMWLNVLSGIIQSGLDGYQRTDLRRIVSVFSNILYFFISIYLIKELGLLGLAISQIAQQFFVICINWCILYYIIPEIPVVPYQWSTVLFKEMMVYGVNFQIISLLAIMVEPLIKLLLSKFGGLSEVGYYDMACKLIQKFRMILTNASQVLIPAYTTLYEKKSSIETLYLKNFHFLFSISLIGYSLLCSLSIGISYLWIGHKEPFFVFATVLLSISWFTTTINSPAYFALLGIGKLRWNLIAHLTTPIITVFLGIPAGLYRGSEGIIIARLISSAIGGYLIIYGFHKETNINYKNLLHKDDLILIFQIAILMPISYFLSYFENNFLPFIIMIPLFTLIVVWSFFYHSTGRDLKNLWGL